MKLDIEQIQKHLQLLGFSGKTIYLRFFYGKNDPRKNKDAGKKATWTKTLNQKVLTNYQKDGRGVYLVVNGQGHTDKEVNLGNVIFCEHDHLDKEIQLNLWQGLNLPIPTFQVDTGGKSIHSYWVLSESIDIDLWRKLQSDLLEFTDADRSIKNPSRVMRLAGCYHVDYSEDKLVFNQSKIVTCSEIKYSFEDLRAAIPEAKSIKQPSAKLPIETKASNTDIVIPDLYFYLPHADRELIDNGCTTNRNSNGAKLARNLIGTTNRLIFLSLPFGDNPYSLFISYCQKCSQDDWCLDEWDKIYSKAEKSNPSATLTDDALLNCYNAWQKKGNQKNLKPTQSDSPKTKKVELRPLITEKNSEPKQPIREVDSVHYGKKNLSPLELLEFLENNLKHRLRFDELKSEVLLDGKPITFGTDVKFWFLYNFGEVAPKDELYDCLIFFAKQNSFNPIVEYFDSLKNVKPADISELSTKYFGTNEPIYNRMVEMWLISAVARVLSVDKIQKTGCQVDHCLVLQSSQGKYKSSWFKTLGGAWFTDSIHDIENKDSLLTLHKSWIVELCEIDRITSKKAAGILKQFINQQVDSFRKPYAKEPDDYPRTNVFCATVNPSRFLVDEENRRFWIIPVSDSIKEIDIELLKKERDQIWAGALKAYLEGAIWYPDENEKKLIREINDNFTEIDIWEEPIKEAIEDKDMVSTFDILVDVIKIPVAMIQRRDEMRVSKILNHLGWLKEVRRQDNFGKTRRFRLNPYINGKVGKVGKTSTNIGFEDYQPTYQPETRLVNNEVGKSTNLPTNQKNDETPISQGFYQPTNLYQNNAQTSQTNHHFKIGDTVVNPIRPHETLTIVEIDGNMVKVKHPFGVEWLTFSDIQ